MADPQEVVIVDQQGTEHVFPAGFDPKRAAAIVRGQSTSEPYNPALYRPSTSPVFESGQEPLLQRLQQLVSRISLANPERPQIVPELQPLGRLMELADRIMPFSVPTDIALGNAAGQAGANTGSAVGDAAARVKNGVQVHPSALLDFKVNQPLAWLKNAISLRQPESAPPSAPTLPSATDVSPLEFTRQLKAARQASAASESAVGDMPLPSGRPAASAPPALSPDSILSPEAVAQRLAQKAKSPQQLLNEEAIARRRAAYQSRQAEQAPVPEAQGKPSLTADETKLYLQLRAAGKTDQQAQDAIESARMMNALYGLKTPTAAQKRFPKGNRGKSQPPRSDEN